MKNVLIMIIFTFILATSCSKDESITKQTDENGAIVSLPYSWKVSLHEGSQQSNSYFDTSILYNNGIAIPTTDNDGNRYMSMIDTDDGDILWKWDDRYNS
ncbi:MAG: hypothetical protein U9R32_02330, partial [Bacteroidota bacterium]|nr:hypothetical protein [Bacteroidota bacterium]